MIIYVYVCIYIYICIGDVYRMSRVSARFVNPQTESAYVKSRQDYYHDCCYYCM